MIAKDAIRQGHSLSNMREVAMPEVQTVLDAIEEAIGEKLTENLFKKPNRFDL